MSDRSDRIKELAESNSEHLWAFVIGLPRPWTGVVTLILFFFVGLGVIALWRWL